MKKLILLLIFSAFGYGQGYYYSSKGVDGVASFVLTETKQTSAGVFNEDGTMITQLWHDSTMTAGTYEIPEWDGLDQEGNAATGDIIKVVAHNVEYDWRGARIGNTSDDLTGPNRHYGYTTFFKLKAIGSDIFYSNSFNEQRFTANKFSQNDIQSKTGILGKGATSKYIAYDDDYVYWSSEDFRDDGSDIKTWVYVTKRSDDTQHNFSNASTLPVDNGVGTWFHNYTSAINYLGGGGYHITGLARQGNYLFIARQQIDRIHVLDVTDGAALDQTITTVTAPREITNDASGNIWVIEGTNDIKRYPVNGDGTLGTSDLTLESSTDERLAMEVSPDGTEIAVVEGGTREQVVFYSTTTGLETGTLGTTGGYNNDPTVTDYKFYITPSETRYFDTDIWNKDKNHASVTYEADGDIWVLDPNNYRILKYNSSLVYQDQVQYLPDPLTSTIDVNDHTRLFCGWLEFEIDYTAENLEDAWVFKRSWGKNITDEFQAIFTRFRSVATLSNGKTYALIEVDSPKRQHIVELDEDGVRYTGIELASWPSGTYETNGDITFYKPGVATNVDVFRIDRFPLTGFSGDDPTYGSLTSLVTFGNVQPTDPVYLGDSKSRPAQNDDGNWVVLNPLKSVTNGVGGNDAYHLGIYNESNDLLVKTAQATATGYNGAYPLDGGYDIGNGVVNPASTSMTFRHSILWGYHGEFWKSGPQANYYHHHHKSGLFLKVFGTAWNQNPNGISFSSPNPSGIANVWTPFDEMAGNALTPLTINHPNDSDKAVLFHGDEQWHGAVHWWDIKGLNSIQEFNMDLE